jgi:UDP-N-acetylmuramate: L-alanyl-gamma-D-glutamyl-meso-diaminopimelate ligase
LKVHLIGVGGTGMGALAGLLVEAGHEVRGSDGPLYPPMSTLLAELGIEVLEGYRPENLDWAPERVVVGNICRVDHVEAVAAAERGLTLTSFPALLSELFLSTRHPVVVAGTHGKTTTSTLMAAVLTAAGHDPGYLIGGLPQGGGRSFALGARPDGASSPPYFIVEGDEYDCAFFDKRPKFVHYLPRTVILTGVEFDHADIYPDMEAVERAFAMLVEQVPPRGRILVCADSAVAVRLCTGCAGVVETYSATPGVAADWQATAQPAGTSLELSITCRGEAVAGLERVALPMTGAHNAANALAVAAAARRLGLDGAAVAAGLAGFAGVRRRQEVRGVARGVTVIDDFAHHPTAIAETLAGLRGAHGEGRLVAVFEPRSATSRRSVFQQRFVEALAVADRVVLAALHAPEGIPREQRLDPGKVVADLERGGTAAALIAEVPQIVEHLLQTCREGDTVVVMSSGGFGGLIERLLAALEEDRVGQSARRNGPEARRALERQRPK